MALSFTSPAFAQPSADAPPEVKSRESIEAGGVTPDTIVGVIAPKTREIESKLQIALEQADAFKAQVRSAKVKSTEELLVKTRRQRQDLLSTLDSAILIQQHLEPQVKTSYPAVGRNEDYLALQAALDSLDQITTNWDEKLRHPREAEGKGKVIADIEIVEDLTRYALKEAGEFNKSVS